MIVAHVIKSVINVVLELWNKASGITITFDHSRENLKKLYCNANIKNINNE